MSALAPLATELDRWAEAGRTATLWWRDDDAVRPTPALERLRATAGARPVVVAVIPAGAESGLGPWLDHWPGAAVVQHGWRHLNHAPPEGKKAELGADRPADAVLADVAAGRERLAARLGARALPVLVPPWNRIAGDAAARLGEAGIQVLSVHGARRGEPGPRRVNTHADIVDWRGSGGFVGPEAAVALLTRHLAARRAGIVDPGEPTGLLTHHLIHGDDVWDFLAELAAFDHPALAWPDAGHLFGTDPP